MDRDEFLCVLKQSGDRGMLIETCRRYLLHGTPHVFSGREEEFFDFRRRIADKFSVGFYEVFLVGSAKLGFSIHKDKQFDLDSDIDVVIVSGRLFNEFMDKIRHYQNELRRSRKVVTEREIKMYHQFLEYTALGWMRPDKLPISFAMLSLKNEWFDFFRSISNGKSEIGDYKVAGGVFRSYAHLEGYLLDGLHDVYNSLHVKEQT